MVVVNAHKRHIENIQIAAANFISKLGNTSIS